MLYRCRQQASERLVDVPKVTDLGGTGASHTQVFLRPRPASLPVHATVLLHHRSSYSSEQDGEGAPEPQITLRKRSSGEGTRFTHCYWGVTSRMKLERQSLTRRPGPWNSAPTPCHLFLKGLALIPGSPASSHQFGASPKENLLSIAGK